MKNKILKGISYIMGIVFVVSVTAMDSDSYIPAVASVVSLTWLSLFAYANRDYLEN